MARESRIALDMDECAKEVSLLVQNLGQILKTKLLGGKVVWIHFLPLSWKPKMAVSEKGN